MKLFLPKQKSLAVSRDGDPTDTNGTRTDSDFPPFIYGGHDDDLVPGPVQDLANPEPVAFWWVIHVQVQYTVVQY